MSEKFPQIFVISLKNSSRREIISQRLNVLGLEFEFFDGVDGRALSQEVLQKVDYEYYLKRFNGENKLTLGEIGCALSHIKIYEHMAKTNLKEAIILEDDAIVSSEFKQIVQAALQKAPKNKELIYLSHGKAKIFPLTYSLPQRYRLARYLRPSKNSKRVIIMAAAYYLSLNGAKKILSHAHPLRLPADFLLGALQLTGLKTYGVEPSCVFTGTKSEIDMIEDRYNKK